MKTMITFFVLLTLTQQVFAGAELKGSKQSMKRQNIQANKEGLSRLSEKDLKEFKSKKLIVPLPENDNLDIDERLSQKYTWCRPWTRRFLLDVSAEFNKKFQNSLQVNSAVRTKEKQRSLQRSNGNAASFKPGLKQSSHLTGSTVDIAKKNLSHEEILWLRKRLTSLEKKGFVEATEERRQSVFHVMVFKNYKKS